MKSNKIKKFLFSFEQIPSLIYLLKWILICLTLGAIVGSISAFFLLSLDWATNYRESHLWIIALLPLGGLIIGLSYHYYGSSVVKGNNLLIEEFHSPKKVIPFRMVPLVLFGTLVTHFFGGLLVVREQQSKLVVQLPIDLQKSSNYLNVIERLFSLQVSVQVLPLCLEHPWLAEFSHWKF